MESRSTHLALLSLALLLLVSTGRCEDIPQAANMGVGNPGGDIDKSTPQAPSQLQLEHGDLERELQDEMKRFDQPFLDCDDQLRKIIGNVQNSIKLHNHDSARKFLHMMRGYNPDTTRSPCDDKPTTTTPPRPSSNSPNGYVVTNKAKDVKTNGSGRLSNQGDVLWHLQLTFLSSIVLNILWR